jgi:hypothetical protein
MLIIALVLAVIGLAALVFAVVTSNELIAWVCIGASVLGVVLLIIDALQERQRREAGAITEEPAPEDEAESHGEEVGPGYEPVSDSGETASEYADYPEDTSDEGDEASAAADSGTDEEAAPEYDRGGSVSDDHNTR